MPVIGLWNRFVARVCAQETGTLLAWFRIAMAAIVFVDVCSLLIAGQIDGLYIPISEGGLAPANRFLNPFIWAFGHTTTMTWATVASTLIFSTLAMIGLGGRVVTFGLLQSVLLLHAIPEDIGGGYDRLMTNGLFVMFLGNTTATWSLDCKLRTGSWTSDRKVYATARYVGIIQLITTYVVTGLAKTGYGWGYPFDGVYYALQRWAYIRSGELPWLADIFPLTQIGTIVAWWWEIGFLLMIPWWFAHLGWWGDKAKAWAKTLDLRWPFLIIGLITHGTLVLFMNLGTFTAVTFAFYILWLDPPKDWKLLNR